MVGIKERVEDVITSVSDDRKYRGLELENGMKIMLISDPTTDKAAAALDVNVGYMYDPEGLPGLAHFCEHMLTLGSEKYPTENDYNKYLADHGGMNNAFTTSDHTCYYFDITPEHFLGALDRFSQYFVQPLFTESMTEREVNAINLEHEKNILNDTWRLDQFDKSTSNLNHDFNRFGTGTLETLFNIPKEKGINVRNELLKFHEEWYSSHIMCFALLGQESLDELEALVLNYFTQVPKKNIEVKSWTDHPFGPDCLQVKAYIIPVKDLRNLILTFPIPDLREHHEAKPEQYISHLLGHEGPGSLLSALKKRSWCNSLVAGRKAGAKGFSFFCVNVDLTQTGIDHIDDIVTLVFQYIALIKKEGPLEWVYEENNLLANMQFQYKDKELPRGYVTSTVSFMHKYPLKQVLSGPFLFSKWDPKLVNDVLDYLIPSKVRIIIVGKKFQNIVNEQEKWYGTDYKLEKIPPELILSWESVSLCDELKIPPKNDLIPTEFDLRPQSDSNVPFPQVIRQDDLIRVWFKQDDEFLLPKLNATFELKTPLAYLNPLTANNTHMFLNLFKDALTEYSYIAELAGLKWELMNTKYGMVLTIGGFNHKQPLFLENVMQKMVSFKVNKERFDILRENYVRTLKNFEIEQPYQHAEYYLAVLMNEHAWGKEDLLAATEYLTVESLEKFVPDFFSNMFIECLIHGNASEEEALKMSSTVESCLKSFVPI